MRGEQVVGGTVYTDEGVTTIGAGRTVRVLVNGDVSLGYTDTTDASGDYSIINPKWIYKKGGIYVQKN